MRSLLQLKFPQWTYSIAQQFARARNAVSRKRAGADRGTRTDQVIENAPDCSCSHGPSGA
jgi:hypothetical protein